METESCKICEIVHELTVLKTKRLDLEREIILKEEELYREMVTNIKKK